MQRLEMLFLRSVLYSHAAEPALHFCIASQHEISLHLSVESEVIFNVACIRVG